MKRTGDRSIKKTCLFPVILRFRLKKGESIIFSASTEEVKTSTLKRKFQQMENKRERRDDFESCLTYSASQFIVHEGKDTEVVAGYPWFGAGDATRLLPFRV